MVKARQKGYRVYLYFVATEDASINIDRVKSRVLQKGHGVLPEVVEKRSFKSLQQLRKAVQNSDRAYVWDNSEAVSFLIAEIENGVEVSLADSLNVPGWFVKYLVENTED